MNEFQLLMIALVLVCAAVLAVTLTSVTSRRTLLTSLGLLVLGGIVMIAGTGTVGVIVGALLSVGGSAVLWQHRQASSSLLLETPVWALGPPILLAYMFVDYATTTQQRWSPALTNSVLGLGIAMLLIATIGAATAQRLRTALRWQTTAQWALLPIVFGTAQPAADPIAAGLLAHTIVVTTTLGLTLGILHYVAGNDDIATLRLRQPLRRAGTAYALAAASSVGFPPLLGYALRRVVVLLALPLPWLPPVLLAMSSLLALSYLPALIIFWSSTRHSLLVTRPSPGTWPLVLMLALLVAGAVPDAVWQWLLGDPAVTEPQPLPLGALVQTALTGAIVMIVVLLAWRALRRRTLAANHTGEHAWELPFAALRAVLRLAARRSR
jgi:formate hydrogenlyase subunit 3/multisubunit Na+/H+ antiporter MnhD subunit